MMEYLAKGKRGLVYRQGNTVIKKPHPASTAINNIKREADFLRLLNRKKIGPTFIAFENDSLIMEYIEGIPIGTWIESADALSIKKILVEVLEQCFTMDSLGINKQEMTNPYKHIIIRKGKPVMIDFERCRFTQRPRNVTQFIQYIVSKTMEEKLRAKTIHYEKKELLALAKQYAGDHSQARCDRIISFLQENR